MNFTVDLSLNTLIISGVVALVGYLLKGVAWAVIEAIKTLINKLVETIAKVELLDSKIGKLTDAVGDHEKLRRDVNEYYRQFRELKALFDDSKRSQ